MKKETRTVVYDDGLRLEAYHFEGIRQPFPNHFHEHYVIGSVEDGTRRLSCRNREYSIEKGRIVLFGPWDNHACVQNDDGTFDYRGFNIAKEVMLNLAEEVRLWRWLSGRAFQTRAISRIILTSLPGLLRVFTMKFFRKRMGMAGRWKGRVALMGNRRIAGHLAAVFTILIWGTAFISTKVLLEDFMPVEILFFRFVMGFVALFLACPHQMKTADHRQEITFVLAGLVLAAAGLSLSGYHGKGRELDE